MESPLDPEHGTLVRDQRRHANMPRGKDGMLMVRRDAGLAVAGRGAGSFRAPDADRHAVRARGTGAAWLMRHDALGRMSGA